MDIHEILASEIKKQVLTIFGPTSTWTEAEKAASFASLRNMAENYARRIEGLDPNFRPHDFIHRCGV